MPSPSSRALWIDYLRSFVIILVVAHHSSLAYTTFAHFQSPLYIRSTHPIVDPHRWIGLDIFENFNDIFFMALMFFISGLFIVPALRRKDRARFIRDRFFRLFLPFVIGVTVVSLLAYYPSYLRTSPANTSISGYLNDYFIKEGWPAGPAWFIGVLFLFNVLVALGYPFFSIWLEKLGAFMSRLKDKPVRLFRYWWLVTAVLYLPFLSLFGAGSWWSLGPFAFQQSRIILYFGYFVAGIALGALPLGAGLLSAGTTFTRRWPFWLISCLLAYALLTVVGYRLYYLLNTHAIGLWSAGAIYELIYIASSTLNCLAFLSIFRSWDPTPNPGWDSLSANAYGIYLVHYAFVIWCQFLLIPLAWAAFPKFVVTFLVALSASWLLTYVLRKIPLVAKYL